MIETLNQIIEDGFQKGLVHNFTSPKPNKENSTVIIEENEMVNFGSCSYLGLEKHENLKEGVIDAVTKYGTQFSSSRTYLSINLYKDLEGLLYNIFERPLIVSASTTLGHLATIPIVVGKNDAVILDLQVHSSIQMTVQQLKAKNIPIYIIKHNCMESLEAKIKALNNKHDKIWYFADGVYSMYGDYAPFEKLDELLIKYKKFHLYIDDAHGMGWTGKHGCGVVNSKMKQFEKIILAVSLNKSFASAGGCIIFPNKEMERTVRNCGATYIFSGPIQPPMLGAAIASAKLHLSDDILPIQSHLADLIAFTNHKIQQFGLPQFQVTNSPLFFIPVGLPKICSDIISKMKEKGYFLNSASFPAVAMRKSGLRFMVNSFLNKEQINKMLETLCEVYTDAIFENKTDFNKIAETFNISKFIPSTKREINKTSENQELKSEVFYSINEIDEKEWNTIFNKNGTLTYKNIQLIENIYKNNESPENNWDFCYLIVRDFNNDVVLATLIASALTKDDMFHPAETSKKIEAIREEEDQYYLTSKTLITGTMISKGNHLYIDYNNDQWKSALTIFINQLTKLMDSCQASKVLIRDFYNDQHLKLESEMLNHGYIKFKLLDNMVVKDLGWENTDEYLQNLGQKYRYNVRKEILKFESNFITSTIKPKSEDEIIAAYKLYENVYEKSYDLNVFKLPYTYFKSIFQSDEYDIIRLYLNEPDTTENKLVGVMFSHINQDVYNALIVGLDYDYVYSHNTYKQILYQTVQRANKLRCSKIDLAFTAEMEKKKLGARPEKVHAFVQTSEHLKGSILEYL